VSFDKERARDACTHIGYGDAVRTVILPAALARIEQLETLCREIVAAWESLPGGRNYSPREVEAWLADRMKPQIDAIRAELEGK
jgi:hypothetical protein